MLSLKSESGVFKLSQATWLMMLLYVFCNMKNYLCMKKMPKASSNSWRGSLVKTTLAEKWYLFSSRSMDVSHSLWGKYSGVWCPVSKSCSLLKVTLLFTINLSTLSATLHLLLFHRSGHNPDLPKATMLLYNNTNVPLLLCYRHYHLFSACPVLISVIVLWKENNLLLHHNPWYIFYCHYISIAHEQYVGIGRKLYGCIYCPTIPVTLHWHDH